MSVLNDLDGTWRGPYTVIAPDSNRRCPGGHWRGYA